MVINLNVTDKKGIVELEELTKEGLREVVFMAKEMIQHIEEDFLNESEKIN